ncbi:MAG: DUF2804 domain-containing protein [Clostridiales bacterium]|nr:DUF2804 domain-containing protein [Clostridiales bacterium]
MADSSQDKRLESGALLDDNGELIESGYAFSQVKTYDRAAVRRKRLRIKEWDYYYFGDDKRGVALTVADNSYMSLGSVSVLDFEHLTYITKSKIGLFPKGKLNMPKACESGDVLFDKGGVKIEFTNGGGERKLEATYKKFDGKQDFWCEIVLEPYVGDNITTATPFNKRRQFYYNTKINCLKGHGTVRVGDDRHEFVGGSGVLDWGRGVWPYKNVWYWSSLSTEVNGIPFGLNLGYGFGNPTATENTVFYGGKAHKLNNVKFDIPFTLGAIDYLKPWKIEDDEGRLQLTFYPVIDRKDKMNVGLLSTDQHQVFGKFYGKATLDDGTIVTVTDKIGFAEHVRNKW